MKVLSTAAVAMSLALAGCQDFDKGDAVNARVGRSRGDECLIAMTIDADARNNSRVLVARLMTPECERSRAAASIPGSIN